jgi:hypothetical protein
MPISFSSCGFIEGALAGPREIDLNNSSSVECIDFNNLIMLVRYLMLYSNLRHVYKIKIEHFSSILSRSGLF